MEQKDNLWVRMLSGRLSQADAATEAGVDRSTISNQRRTARDGALAALSTKPGRPKASKAERTEVAELGAEVNRLQQTMIEQAIELAALPGKQSGMSDPIPTRVPPAENPAAVSAVRDRSANTI